MYILQTYVLFSLYLTANLMYRQKSLQPQFRKYYTHNVTMYDVIGLTIE